MTGAEHTLGFHEGETLYTLAKTYPTLKLCLIEAVQNGIDAGATHIYVGVDLMERRLAVCDNGDGVTTEKFKKALQSVGKGIKSRDALGRFGRGLIASIHLGQSMTFLSRPRGGQKVNSWLFIGESLRRQHRDLKVPFQELDEFPALPEPFTHSHNEARSARRSRVEWRTMLLVDRVTDDRTIAAIDPAELDQAIRTKLGHGMRRKGTTVFLKVRDHAGLITKRRIDPAAYDGERLDTVAYSTQGAGEVAFELFRARLTAGRRKGQVVVMQTGDAYPVTIPELRVQAMGAGWYGRDATLAEIKEGIDALASGYFEGSIKAERVVLAPERTKFELDDALTDVLALIGDWFDKVGRALMNNAREEQQEKRYRELGDRSLERLLTQLQDNPALAGLAVDLRDVLPAARTNRPRNPSGSTSGRKVSSTPTRRVVVTPRQQPEGSPGSPVSTFITFAYELLKGSARLWEYESETGVLTFNIRHPLWIRVDETNGKHLPKHDKQVMNLQEWLAFKLLLLLADGVDPMDVELHRTAIDREAQYYIEVFILR
jgi:hypothetical protein